MGTRGIIGLRIDGVDKLTYNHFDSYPDSLGKDTVKFLKGALKDRPALDEKARALTLVAENTTPTEEQIEALSQYADTRVSGGDKKEWYVLLRETQGDLNKILLSGFAINNAEFMADSLMNEFSYIVNLDENVLEVYRGFQHEKHDKGRYADMKRARDYTHLSAPYFAMALVLSIPFGEVLEKSVDGLVDEMNEACKQRGEDGEEM